MEHVNISVININHNKTNNIINKDTIITLNHKKHKNIRTLARVIHTTLGPIYNCDILSHIKINLKINNC